MKVEKDRVLEPIKSLAPLRCVVILDLFYAELSGFLVLSARRGSPLNSFIQSLLLKDVFDNMKDTDFFFLLLFFQITKLVQMDASITRSFHIIEFGYFFQQWINIMMSPVPDVIETITEYACRIWILANHFTKKVFTFTVKGWKIKTSGDISSLTEYSWWWYLLQ